MKTGSRAMNERRGLWLRRMAGGLALSAAVLGGVAIGPGVAPATAAVVQDGAEMDEIVLRNGRVVKGRITGETATEIQITVVYAGIEAPTSFSKSEILTVRRAAERTDAVEGGAEPAGEIRTPRSRRSDEPSAALTGDRAPSVYHMTLTGWLGSDIAVTPVRDALEAVGRGDTDENGEPSPPDYLIIELDRRWSDQFGFDLGDDVYNFDEFSVAQGIVDLFTKEFPQRWDEMPHIVVWVKNAMGGAAFMPFVGDTIVFHPDGRMGGIGNLGEMFEGVGDEVVRQKQRSLRMARAQGLAIEGGYDYRLVTAMARMDYELSYKFDGGVVEIMERTAENPGEFTLTENGRIPENVDSLRERVSGTGNDVLTLRENTARHLGVSAGTADSLDDVLTIMGIYRNHRMLDNRSDAIMENWSRSLKRAERELPKMWQEYNEIPVGGTFQETRRGLGQRIRMLEDIKATLERFNGGGDFPALPPQRVGVPGAAQINVMIEQHRVELIQARP
jgi:hypothetical protein